MSLRKRFALFTVIFLALAGVFVLFVELQLNGIKEIRSHLKDDRSETHLLLEAHTTLFQLHDIAEGSDGVAKASATAPLVQLYGKQLSELRKHAKRGVQDKQGELQELAAAEELTANYAAWAELQARIEKGNIDHEEFIYTANKLYHEGTAGVMDFSHGTWEELDDALEALGSTEDSLETLTREWTAGMVGLLGAAWLGFFLWLMRPIARLRRMVHSMHEHNFQVETHGSEPGEIGELTRAFIEMSQELSAFTRDLELRVAARTSELAASREQLRQMLDRLPDAIGLVDADGRLLLTNDSYRRMFGELQKSPLNEVRRHTPTPQGYYTWTYAGGQSHVIDVQSYRLIPHETEPERFVTLEYVREMTRQCEVEAALATSQTMAVIGRLSSGIAHEINNPLTAIAACAEGLLKRREGLLEAHAEYLTTIRDEVFRCKEITEKLLDFSRQRPEPPMLVHVGQLARDAVKLVEQLASRKNVTIDFQCDDDDATYSSSRAIKQVLLNLLLNAIEACGTDGEVHVGIEGGDDHLMIEIRDNGAGISEEELPRIFEPFYTNRRDNSGTGLGLFVCQGLVQALGGSIRAESGGKGLGATFYFVLPRRMSVAKKSEELAESNANG